MPQPETYVDVDAGDLIHAERARLAELLDDLNASQWAERSLCTEWSVEQTAAHLTATAHTGTLAWIWSMVRAGFDPGKHNDRMLRRYLGGGPRETLEAFRAAIPLRLSPTKDLAAFLGEVLVHGQDVARPLGLGLVPDPEGVLVVARFFASRDFTVRSKTLIDGLRLEASDASFTSGSGPVVRGRLLDLVMAIAGRPGSCDEFLGEGAAELRRRLG